MLLSSWTIAEAQVRVDRLFIAKGDTFELKNSDILVADSIVMEDSAVLRLNPLKSENYIRAAMVRIGKGCLIIGNGKEGRRGSNGQAGVSPLGPCQHAGPGRNGGAGLDGTPAINLFLYIDQIKTLGTLTIQLSGGNGGDGGDGGPGGGGGPGTRHCSGGNGGDGGNGGKGGNGGIGGTLTLGGKAERALRDSLGENLILQNRGGTFGYGGMPGHGGPAGLAPDRKHGKPGLQGKEGHDGRPGNMGTIVFEENNR